MNLNHSPNPSSIVSPLLDHHHDPQQASSSFSLHSFINPLQLQGQLQGDRSHDYDHHSLIDNSTWKGKNTKKRLSTKIRLSDRMLNSSWTRSVTLQANKHDPNLKKVDHGDQKHRISSPSHTGANYNNNNMDSSTTPVRVCSDCNTTKTPLWRSGPRGPKSLCNACGIRQRKAKRRAMALAAANGSSSVEAKIITKEPNDGHHQYLLPYNKRFRDHDHISYNKNDQHAITEAAILLMAISSGLVHGCH